MNRYRYSILSYTFARERILSNNSLDSFERDSLYVHDLDQMYTDQSVKLEGDLNYLKSKYPTILEPLVSLVKKMDS